MKQQRGQLPGDSERHDNGRVKRYVAKLRDQSGDRARREP